MKKLAIFFTLICAGLLFASCQSDESNDVLSSVQLEVIENPYAIDEGNAISDGKSFLQELSNGGNISLRSAEIESLDAEIKECSFTITVPDGSMVH